MSLNAIKTDENGKILNFYWVGTTNGLKQGDKLPDGSVIEEIDESLLSSIDTHHAYFKDGVLKADPDYTPWHPEPVEAPKELTNEQITQAIAQMTVLIAQRGQE